MMRSRSALQSKSDTLTWIGFALALVALVVVSVAGVRGLRLADRGGAALSGEFERALGLEQVAVGVVDLQRRVAALARERKPGGGETVAGALRDLRAALLAVREGTADPARQDAVDRLVSALDGYGADVNPLIQGRAVSDAVVAGLEVKAREVGDLIQAELQIAARTAAAARTEREGAAGTSVALIAGLACFGVLVGGAAVWRTRRGVVRLTADIDDVTGDLARVFTALAEGDLTRKVGTKHNRAFVKMADDVNATVEKLAGMVARIHTAAGTIAAASAEVAAGGSDLADRTERQAAALEETAAALEQLANTFKGYCEHAHEANTMVGDARKAGEHGVTVVASAIEAMGRIVEASEKIKDIIRVTEEISRRINMLAINASVEAARAGEAGKGFGVVAREVGSLAERSAHASQQIKDLIVNSDSQIQYGVQMVTQSGGALQTIVGSVDRAASLFNDIAINAAAQSGMLHEINIAVGQMDETTQMNAALAEQTCAASQSMRQESTGLKELVSFFMVEAGDTGHGLGRHIVLIESTKLDHISFMKRIREAISGERDTKPDEVSDHHHCRLGKWYDTIELPVVRLNPVYRALERPHTLVHAAGRRALERHAAGDQAGCELALKEMEAASGQVLGCIDALAADLRGHDHDSGPDESPAAETGRARRRPRRPAPASSAPRRLEAPSGSGTPRASVTARGALRHADEAHDREWKEF